MSDDESDSDGSTESDSDDSNESYWDESNESENVMSSEPSTSRETEECLPTEALEGLEPHNNLKHLQITGYNGATSPSWLSRNISVTSLQTLHLEDCRKWQILPSLRGLPFLTKLKLSGMPKVVKMSVPSLEELVLIKMPKLETCSCISSRDLNSCLRVLVIKNCTALKVFDLFGNGHNFKIEQKSWLPRLCELIIHNCPLLLVPHPLPSSSTISRISMSGILGFPRIEALSCGSLTIGKDPEKEHSSDGECDLDVDRYDWCSDELSVLDEKILASHNPRFLTHLMIGYCEELTSISFKGLSELVSLKTLRIIECPVLSGFDVPPEHTPEYLTAANCNALQCLVYLEIDSCGIAWEWLSLILQHAPALTSLDLDSCPKLGYLQLNSCTALEKLVIHGTAVCVLDGLKSLKKLEVYSNQHLKSLQLHSCTALEELNIRICTSLSTLEGFQSLGSLRHLHLRACPGLHSCLEGLPVQDYELCPRLEFLYISDFSFLTTSFCKQLTSLQRLEFCCWGGEIQAAGLTDEQERGLLLLGSLTELRFWNYKYLNNLPAGLHKLRSLQVLEISCCPSISGLPYLPPSLEDLRIVGGSEGLKLQSKSRASSKLKVKIE